ASPSCRASSPPRRSSSGSSSRFPSGRRFSGIFRWFIRRKDFIPSWSAASCSSPGCGWPACARRPASRLRRSSRLNSLPDLVPPHGGGLLKPRMLSGEALAAECARARTLRTVRVSSREKGDLVMLGIGGFTPLEGFMTRADCEGVCKDYRTAAGLFWPIPITLSVDAPTAESIRISDSIALTDPETDEPLATMRVSEKYSIDKLHECKSVFRTADAAHRAEEHTS